MWLWRPSKGINSAHKAELQCLYNDKLTAQMDSDHNTHVSIFNGVTETHFLSFFFFFFFLLTRGKKNDPMWSGHSGSRWSAVDSDDTCWCFAYIQTTRGGWRLTQRPFLRPALSKKKNQLLQVLYIYAHILKKMFIFCQCKNSEFMLA